MRSCLPFPEGPIHASLTVSARYWCSLLCLSWNSSTQCDHTDGGLCHQEVTQELGLATSPLEHSLPTSRCSISCLPPEQSRVASSWFVPTQFSLLQNSGPQVEVCCFALCSPTGCGLWSSQDFPRLATPWLLGFSPGEPAVSLASLCVFLGA